MKSVLDGEAMAHRKDGLPDVTANIGEAIPTARYWQLRRQRTRSIINSIAPVV
jgi:hypothetical protein